jgi:hypothetical protein
MVNNPDLDILAFADVSTQSETAVAGYQNDVVVGYNNDGLSGGFVGFGSSLMGYAQSRDGGATFADLGVIPVPGNVANLGDPTIRVNRSGTFFASAIAFVGIPGFPAEYTVGVWRSTDRGLSWLNPVFPPIPLLPPTTSNPFGFADKPFLRVDTTRASSAGNLYLTWTNFPNSPLPPRIVFSRSTDGGASFSPPIFLSDPAEAAQGSEAAIGPGGVVYVTWWRIEGAFPAIMVARSADFGRTFSRPVVAAPIVPIGFFSGNMSGNFRTNSFPRIDVNPVNGNVYIVYASNPQGTADGADVYVVRSTDRGATWSSPVRVNDDSTQNDQFFPAVAVNGTGTAKVLWYDRRNSSNNLGIDVYAATLMETATSLQAARNERVTTVNSLPAVGYDPILDPTYMGDYIDITPVITSTGRGTDFLAAWGDTRRVVITSGGQRHDQDVLFRRIF